MGCFWSCEGGSDRCQHCNRRAVNNLIIVNNECEICLQRAARPQESIPHGSRITSIPLRHLFGEFRCKCGREWASRSSWQARYQICRRCRKKVYAHTQRELRSGDFSRDRGNKQDHPKELCQMCTELGYYCGKLRC